MEIRVAGRYRLGRKLGSGSFGEIYMGRHCIYEEDVAIKLEPVRTRHPQLMYESKLYKILCGGIGIPNIFWYGVEGDYNVMVMELLGPSLEDLFLIMGRQFTLKTVLMIADQTMNRVEYVHSKSFLHRDIKPDNFVIGRGKRVSVIYVIDFGLAKKFRDPRTLMHIPYREGKHLTGTARYASISTHLGIEQGRRDDLEAIGYVLLYFLRGSLPWQGLKAGNKKDKYDKIMEKKMSTPIESLCRYLPFEFSTYMNYVRSLRFEDRPDYGYLRRLLKDLFFRETLCYDFVFDWSSRITPNGKKKDDGSDPNNGVSEKGEEPSTTVLRGLASAKHPKSNGADQTAANGNGVIPSTTATGVPNTANTDGVTGVGGATSGNNGIVGAGGSGNNDAGSPSGINGGGDTNNALAGGVQIASGEDSGKN